MVTTRRGRNTETSKPVTKQGKKQQGPEGNGSAAARANKGSKKRAAPEPAQQPSVAADNTLKKQKVDSSVVAEDDPVAPQSPPEAGDTTAAADIPTGAGTAMAAEDAQPSSVATAEAPMPTQPAAAATAGAITGAAAPASTDMPISEAVKHIGGTQAGSVTASEQPTAKKAIDAVPVGPDPVAAATATGPTTAGTAGAGTTGTGATAGTGSGGMSQSAAAAGSAAEAGDGNVDGDYYLDAALADSNMGEEEAKPAYQVPATTGTTDATKTGFLAPPAAQQAGSAAEGGAAGGHGIAAEAAAEVPDVPTGLHADTHTIASGISGAPATNSTAAGFDPLAAPTIAPTTASAHDSLLGGAAAQDSSDVPPMFGGDMS